MYIDYFRNMCLKVSFQKRENFVFATLVSAHFAYATLYFDLSLLPLLDTDNVSQMPFCYTSVSWPFILATWPEKYFSVFVKMT